ncbi:ubiquitin carboxyl-terminal hydrolase 26 [Neophocaena asiaeorientalis asiaeorientalis]|uniref:Ubiquitin carboxyl-terminal hydrolase n=1 Tax=Neophocaena asiaeorientalis asiaeorientalis TaxID=1706337 RepID=A0A341AZF1_NEOAA|nr:ubiquitin carboxyl-terminal hydrolase 26 [Neophocaena asiaeorientalis asiaeorientalis]XP_032474874.1 ubiquitin carboxyl-terminal hydrolase 26 [Phocoena sinus]
MAAVIVRGFVRMCNQNTMKSNMREAYIEIVEREGNVILIAYFSTGSYITFQLSNNIEDIVIRPSGEDQNNLYLSLRTNDILNIANLSPGDTEILKKFLDRVHPQPPVRPDRGGSIFASTTTQKAGGKTASHKICKMSSSQSFEKERNETPDDKEMPFCASELPTFTWEELLENDYGKRRPSSGSEMNKDFLQEDTSSRGTVSKMNPLRYVSRRKRELILKRLKQNKKLELGPSFKTDFTGKPYLDVSDLLQRVTEKAYLAFLSESKYGEDDPEWVRLKMIFAFYPGKLRQGFPNLGNTCYMNAVLQSLFLIPSFANDLLNRTFSRGETPLDSFSIRLVQLLILKDIFNIKIKKKLLGNFKNVISAVAEIFSDNTQNDAYEFLGHCLDQIRQNMRKLNTTGKIESEEGNSPQQVSAGSADTEVLVCPVASNFDFELLRSTSCKACGQIVLKAEANNSLSVSLPQRAKARPLSIQSSFDGFFEAEELEYKCGTCKHRSSVAVHKFSRLPRVLIVHLKRYKFSEFGSLRKDDQKVIIPEYLKLSSHCIETTKPPLPLSKNEPLNDFQVLDIFKKMNSEAISSSTASTKQTSESKDSLAPHIRSEKESEPQKCQTLHKASSFKQQQRDLEKDSKLNIIESTLVNSRNEAAIARELLAVGLTMSLEDSSLSLKGAPTSSPDTDRKVAKSRKGNKYKRTNISADFESMPETTEEFCKGKKRRISEKSYQVPEETQQCGGIRLCEQDLGPLFIRRLSGPNAQWHREKCRPTQLNFQGTKVKSQGALGSNKDPGKKGSSDVKKTKSSARKPKREAEMRDSHDYRLIGVISHIGKTPSTGHYISDAYNFERQMWFCYSDLDILNSQETPVQETRLQTGYIFFYMHNEIFEELLEREENSQPHSTEEAVVKVDPEVVKEVASGSHTSP